MKPYFTLENVPGRAAEDLKLLNVLWLSLPALERADDDRARDLLSEWSVDHLDELRRCIERASVVAEALECNVQLYIHWYESSDGKYREPVFDTHTSAVDSNAPTEFYSMVEVNDRGLVGLKEFDWREL